MSDFSIRWEKKAGLERFSNAIGQLSAREVDRIGARALNHTGGKARTQVKRDLARQTGLKSGVIQRALKVRRASAARLEYSISSSGGDIALKYFRPVEFRSGVKASPFGKRQLFKGAFLKGGRFPGRVPISRFGGNVMERETAAKYPVRREKSGVVIPEQMIKGASLEAWNRAMEGLDERFMHEAAYSNALQIFSGGSRF